MTTNQAHHNILKIHSFTSNHSTFENDYHIYTYTKTHTLSEYFFLNSNFKLYIYMLTGCLEEKKKRKKIVKVNNQLTLKMII